MGRGDERCSRAERRMRRSSQVRGRECNAFLEPQITHLATAEVVCQGGKVGR